MLHMFPRAFAGVVFADVGVLFGKLRDAAAHEGLEFKNLVELCLCKSVRHNDCSITVAERQYFGSERQEFLGCVKCHIA